MANNMTTITLPKYTRGEEIFNMVTHIVGGAMGIAVLALCVVGAALNKGAMEVVSVAIYGSTMILLYTMSSIYHGLINIKAKKVFRVLDHCTIYLLIAGTYTPIALGGLVDENLFLGWLLFGIEWGLAAIATTLTAVDMKKYNAFSMICYVVLGWCVLFFLKPVIKVLTVPGFILLLLGGIMYTVGIIIYGIGKKKKYMHSVFHLFVLLGSCLQFFSILFYIVL